jgi:hypothetical protein
MHSSVPSRNATSYVFYYKEVLDVLTHPLLDLVYFKLKI